MTVALRDWPKVMHDFTGASSHMGISLPGMVVGYALVNQVLERVPALANILVNLCELRFVRTSLCRIILTPSSRVPAGMLVHSGVR